MGDHTMFGVGFVVALGMMGCASKPGIYGSALPLNMQPPPPHFAGAYDFDLLDAVQGRSCATRSDADGPASIYWFSGGGLEKLAVDALTSHAIGAAAFEALKDNPDADSVVVTRVLAEAHGPDKVCATVHGRAIKLKKAGEPAASERDDEDNLASPEK